MKKHISVFLNHLKARGYSEQTLAGYKRNFRYFQQYLEREGLTEPNAITRDHIRGFQDWLYHDYKPKRKKTLSLAYQVNILKIIGPLFRFLLREGVVLADPSIHMELPRLPRRVPRDILTQREIRKLLALPDLMKTSGYRDRLIMELLYGTGIRRSELENIKLGDLNLDDRELLIREGKGGKDRAVPIPRKTARFIENWIKRHRGRLLRGRESDYLLLTQWKERLGREYISGMIRKYCKAARIRKHIKPHSFRHTCATHLLKNGAGVRMIQKLLGHSSLCTTQRYTRVEISDLKQVIDKNHPIEDMDA